MAAAAVCERFRLSAKLVHEFFFSRMGSWESILKIHRYILRIKVCKVSSREYIVVSDTWNEIF